MWELAYIARDFPERRKAIYEDLERKNGPMWSQVYEICLTTLKQIESNIDSYNATPLPSSSTPVTDSTSNVLKKDRTTPAPQSSDIFQPSPSPKKSFVRASLEKTLATAATSSDPNSDRVLSPTAKKILSQTRSTLLQATKDVTGSDDASSLLKEYATKFLKSPLGGVFRQSYPRRLSLAVLGQPYGEPSLYMNAAYALTGLAVNSLAEDKYGNVQRDVAAIIRALASITKKLETFRQGLDVHWTDVEGKKECKEVDEILEALKDGLAEMVEAFAPYARDLRLSLTDMRLAREAGGLGRERREEQQEQEMGEVVRRR